MIKQSEKQFISKTLFIDKKNIHGFLKSLFWFFTGVFLGLFFLVSFTFIVFQKKYATVVYPGILINGIDFGGQSPEEVKNYFIQKNSKIADIKFAFVEGENIATISAKQLSVGYNENLLANQIYSIGRSNDLFINISLVFQAYMHGIYLSPSYYYSEKELITFLNPIIQKIHAEPKDALFSFQNGKVIAFSPSFDGQEVNIEMLKNEIFSKIPLVLAQSQPQVVTIQIPIKTLKAKITTDKANNLGIKEQLATGTSFFQHSIPNRIYNLTLAATRLNGILVAPEEIFSFAKAVGDISAFTGYKQAYVIQNGRTVLGDGGGVCQVSTTLFRALLNAGLPIIERHPHAYRVGYYEQDSPAGIDASVYIPEVDLKFKNDTDTYILIQTEIDPTYERLTFFLYGKKDNREVTLTQPFITNQSSPPASLYQDDPNLPKGEIRQVDFAAPGANVSFTREVKKNGKVIIADKFISNYRPWQAVFLRGTKE